MDIVCFKQKTAYEMRISDWSSDVCSSDLVEGLGQDRIVIGIGRFHAPVKAVRPVADIIRRRKQLIVSLHGEAAVATIGGRRSEERRVGKACVSTCRSRWSPYH